MVGELGDPMKIVALHVADLGVCKSGHLLRGDVYSFSQVYAKLER